MTTVTLWRLEELVRQCQLLADQLPEGDSKRVRWQPNERLVRYYTTLGLLDRPAQMRGRTAYYAQRHLLQLLAVKTLQATGATLQDIQLRLAGQADAALENIIGLPADWRERLEAPTAELGTSEPTRFWERAPVPASLAAPPREEFSLVGLELAPGVQLTFDPKRYPHLDAGQLRRAATGLIQYLTGGNDEFDPDAP